MRSLVPAASSGGRRAGGTLRPFAPCGSADVGNSHNRPNVVLEWHVHAELVLFPARMVACGLCRTVEALQRQGGGMKTRKKQFVTVICALLFSAVSAVTQNDGSKSQIVERVIHSKNFAGNKIGVSADRKLAVYLPPGYDGASQRYPVVYFFPSPIQGYRTLFDKSDAQALFDRAIARGTVRSFILVSVDMTTPLGASWFVNSPVTGNWEDFVVQELVPYIDASFHTMPTRDARGLLGEHMGAYGAIRIGMKHADVFGSIYGMNPVGTGSGVQIMDSRPDWDLLAHAASLAQVKKDGFSAIFTSIFQAHLPNPEKPPLYVDLPA